MELDDLLRLVSVPGLLGGGGPNKAALYALLQSLSPTLESRFDEATGNLINYGSDGNSATVSGATQGQTGQLGASEAYLFDGVDDKCTFATGDIAGTNALTTQRWMLLVNMATLGEGDLGTFFNYTTSQELRFAANNVLYGRFITDTTDVNAVSNNNQVDFLNTWTLIFMDYDDANGLGLGRKMRLMRATAASPTTLLTLATDTAATGTFTAPSSDLILGNRTLQNRTSDGLFDGGFVSAGVWSPAGTPADLTLCDQIRSATFGV